jgi:ATP-dependent exoDNAse (exonuclease V) beta subunit
METYAAWKAGRAADRDAASRASIDVITATNAAATLPMVEIGDVEVTVLTTATGIPRPGGVRFGSLVHSLLADVPLEEDGDWAVERLCDAHGRILGATSEEVAAARALVATLLTHPLLRAAIRASREGRCYRETPVTYRLESGQLVEGYVDLAFRDGESMVVVDFKTDRELDGSLERYQKQVALYATAIGRTAGLPTQAFLMRV